MYGNSLFQEETQSIYNTPVQKIRDTSLEYLIAQESFREVDVEEILASISLQNHTLMFPYFFLAVDYSPLFEGIFHS